MKITRIEQQKNKIARANLYIDDEFFVGISQDVLLKLDLFEGKIVDKSELEKINDAEEYQKILTKSFDYISRRMQSERELWTKLKQKEFSKKNIYKAIERLKELGYIDDEKFAKSWVEMRKITRGNKMLRLELRQKGISDETILKYLPDDFEELFQTAYTLVLKKYREKLGQMTKKEKYVKIAGFLARRGFDYSIIKKVIDENET